MGEGTLINKKLKRCYVKECSYLEMSSVGANHIFYSVSVDDFFVAHCSQDDCKR